MDFHGVEQMFFFVRQQNTKSVNLIERDKSAIIPLQNLQEAIDFFAAATDTFGSLPHSM